jgi:hypothetical protein
MFTFNYFSLVCDGEALDRRKRERKKALLIEVGLITLASDYNQFWVGVYDYFVKYFSLKNILK